MRTTIDRKSMKFEQTRRHVCSNWRREWCCG